MEKRYMHRETGSIDTREGWLQSYSKEELEERGFSTAEQAFEHDVGETLIELWPYTVRFFYPNPANNRAEHFDSAADAKLHMRQYDGQTILYSDRDGTTKRIAYSDGNGIVHKI
jgi:hypothetical protein